MKNYLFIILAFLSISQNLFSATTNKDDNSKTGFQIYSNVSDKPQFIHKDYKSFKSFVYSKLKYPLIAKQKGIYGSVILNFIVDIDGIVKNVDIVKGDYPSLNYEAVKAIQGVSGWKVGKIDGLPVPVKLRMTVDFLPSNNFPINKDNLIQSDSEFKKKTEYNNIPMNKNNLFIATVMSFTNSPGWYNYNNSFKYMRKKVAKFNIENEFESIYVVFATDNKAEKNTVGVYDEKKEIKELIQNPANKKILAIGFKIIDGETFFGYKNFEPTGGLVTLDYKKINNNDLTRIIRDSIIKNKKLIFF
jgi:TonB family protein